MTETFRLGSFFRGAKAAGKIVRFYAFTSSKFRPLILVTIVVGLLSIIGLLGHRNSSHATASNDDGLVEVYEYTGDKSPTPMVLQVPKEFRYGSSAGQMRSWGINILTYYPSLTSPRDPANASYGLSCVGFCNGRILVSIEYHPSFLTRHIAPTAADGGARNFLRNYHEPRPPNVRVVDLESEFGFDEVFERTIEPLPGSKSIIPGNPPIVDRYLLNHASDGVHYGSYAHCSMSTKVQACQIHFSLDCNPAISATVNGWQFARMNEASEIQRRVGRFVAAMVKEPECASEAAQR